MKYNDALYNEENTLNAVDLENKYNGGSSGWVDHPALPRAEWKAEVANGDSQVGYWEWVFNKIQNWEPDVDDAELEAKYREAAANLAAHGSSNRFECDENCAVSLSEEGAYVAAWVWVPKESV